LKDEDMLPSKIPNARIFTYDWKAETILDAAQEDLKTHANSLLSKLSEGLPRVRLEGQYHSKIAVV
jgi:hypothetical protein